MNVRPWPRPTSANGDYRADANGESNIKDPEVVLSLANDRSMQFSAIPNGLIRVERRIRDPLVRSIVSVSPTGYR